MSRSVLSFCIKKKSNCHTLCCCSCVCGGGGESQGLLAFFKGGGPVRAAAQADNVAAGDADADIVVQLMY